MRAPKIPKKMDKMKGEGSQETNSEEYKNDGKKEVPKRREEG